MSGDLTWSRHYQHVWQERAGDAQMPYWLRVAALAYGSHRANGHARFKAGEIALVLGTVDTVTGEISPMDRANVQRAIRKATEFGWLTEASGSTCLVVPGHAIAGGKGNPFAPCPQHSRKADRSHQMTYTDPKRRSPNDYAVGHQMTTPGPLTSTNVTALSISSSPVSTKAARPVGHRQSTDPSTQWGETA